MKLQLLTLLTAFSLNVFSQLPTIQWQAGLSGSQMDFSYFIQQTSDGGYIAVGDTYSTDGDFTTNQGNGDGWVAKFDAAGSVQWKKTLGGTSLDDIMSIIETSDGGYITVGRTYSEDGDISGFHHSINTTDCWVVKLNSAGVVQWKKALGGTGSEEGRQIIETTNGYMIAGSSSSNDGDVASNHGSGGTHDYWLVNMDGNGNIIWEKTYGGSGDDMAFCIEKTTDGAFIVGGIATSADGDVSVHNGTGFAYNCWLMKINSAGTIKWEKSFSTTSYTDPSSIKQTPDKGFVISGRSGNVGSLATFDALVMKVDSVGNLQWKKTFGGTQKDEFTGIVVTSNNNYIIAGTTDSNNGDISHFMGGISDAWIIKLDTNGNIINQKTYGGSGDDGFASIQKTTDNSIIVAGFSSSTDNDVSTNSDNLSNNVWVVKFNALDVGIEESQLNNNFSVYPNPAHDIININTSEYSKNNTYNITNALGQTILSSTLAGKQTTVDIHQLAAGIYFLQINDKQLRTYKILKN
ncbi:MAG: T9SS type A sorting domain-containing protein [Bacteroidetes bacterium]|nr:T9SS type A sorting domain-containing protein [Bacteroidota bacterium]